ncbi:molybdenum cofactor sulfurase isoform X1 [Spodoptera frugiperda]|uniref:Molybdenum cofactor sulfurase n=2 Tax=Spodoptera frugiperda TaxID=7108 RepID=A0A9R0EJJ7_SPOFR|nr:molybdenum cofactor sulfurase isoform X1 [Spodoptera frugiperda]
MMSGPYEEANEMNTLSQVIDQEHMIKITSNFTRLGDRCYLENAGATLYPQCLLTAVHEDLVNNVYMNPHSDKYTKDCVEQIRSSILKHFNTDPSTYTVVFTAGTTSALKLVVESFQFSEDDIDNERNNGSFVYLRDNHTSVLGLREIASDKYADIIHISHEDFLLAVSNAGKSHLKRKDKFLNKYDTNTLLVYPAQSNFNGFKYPIDCIDLIKNGCLNSHLKKQLCHINNNWYVLLDAASFVSTNRLDLSATQPDFVCLSFYKIFGYPTGLGAILIKNSSSDVLCQKRYFGGGTVDFVLSTEDMHVKRKDLYERMEDGTIPFLSVLSLKHCFDTMHKLIPKSIYDDIMDTVSYHTYFLAKDLYFQLHDLKHTNGNKAAVTYMDSNFSDIRKQGGIVTFNLLREDGSYIGFVEFQHMADLFNINVRTGCFCNSGSCQRHLVASNKELKEMYKSGHVCGDEIDLIDGRPTGAIRASFGYFNTFKDVDKLIHMICRCFVKTKMKPPKRYLSISHRTILDALKSNKLYNGIAQAQKIWNQHEFFFKKESEDIPHNNNSDAKITLKEVAIFPIKSCGAFKIKSAWKIGPKGFEYDRDWMIIKDNGVCLTQKHTSRMCLIKPKIDLQRRVMVLCFEDKTPISVPLDITSDKKMKNSSLCRSKVCTDIIQGYDCGDEVADWISEALEISYLRLIRQSSDDNRVQKKKQNGEKKLLSLSNQAQFLLINKATVRWLREKIQDPQFVDDVDSLTDRFRGNLVIDMEEELAERDWHRVIIGNQEFKVEGLCPRCQMVCIDQQTGEKTVEPLRTISEQFAGKLRFGIYLSYVGAADNSKDRYLKIHAPVKPIINEDDISR